MAHLAASPALRRAQFCGNTEQGDGGDGEGMEGTVLSLWDRAGSHNRSSHPVPCRADSSRERRAVRGETRCGDERMKRVRCEAGTRDALREAIRHCWWPTAAGQALPRLWGLRDQRRQGKGKPPKKKSQEER